jgi:probable HAF family extracellular repeat protein/VCBS repeat-containing protein
MAIYTYTTLDDRLFTNFTVANGINDTGQIVGYYQDSSFHLHGFLYSGGAYTTVDDPLGTNVTLANGINDTGQIVGYYADSSAVTHGFLYNGGKYTTIDDPLGTEGNGANGINATGQIVGTYGHSGVAHGFLYSGGSSGTYTTLNDPLGTNGTSANGINDKGQIVGNYQDSSGSEHGFLYSGGSNGTYTTLDDPLGTQGTVANGINATGQIAGYYFDSSFHLHGFLYSGGTYTTIDDSLAGPPGTQAYGINVKGQIVGDYGDSSGVHGFLASPVTTPPMVTPDRAHVQLHGTISANAGHGVLANDTDPVPNDALIVSAVDGQAANVGHAVAGTYGTLTLNADGSYSYSANGSHALPSSGVGEDIFTYTDSTGQDGMASSTLTVVVTAAGLTYDAVPAGGSATQANGGHSAVLDGGAGNATLTAVSGNGAVLIGGPSDTLNGANSGKDTFVFTHDFGQNIINGFVAKANGNFDIIQLDHSEFANLAAVQAATHQVGSNTVITDPHSPADTITLTGISLSSLHFDVSHFALV